MRTRPLKEEDDVTNQLTGRADGPVRVPRHKGHWTKDDNSGGARQKESRDTNLFDPGTSEGSLRIKGKETTSDLGSH